MSYPVEGLPPFVNGVLSREAWENRKNEILELFRSEVYGRIPGDPSLSVSYRVADSSPGFMDGRAIRKIIEIRAVRKDREFIFPFQLFVPAGAEKQPVPVILTVNNRELSDSDPSRRTLSPFWPAEMMVARGYAAAVVVTHDIAPDYGENFTLQFHRLFPEYVSGRPGDAWGSISAWAWGISRAVDYLVSDPQIKAREIALAGHSRGGKTSLWCGAQDPRISLVISSCSGCSGAAITRGKTGEHIRDITRAFPFWFSNNYQKYADQEDTMPFDQHFLLALIAPRPLYLSDKTFDTWCDPRSEFESLVQAGQIYQLYGKTGGLGEQLPAPEQTIISGNLGYHIKSGSHNMDEYDWERYLNFCDRHFHPLGSLRGNEGAGSVEAEYV
ncbi:MAG: alpha/beta hydrolase [Treponema sp.]|nr:alpha/beta hydrolase [Treponema sp.]